MLRSSEPMKQLQIALEQRYATKENIDRIAQIAPGARTAVFAIRERYPSIRKVRGLFRRILPFYLYDPLSKILDRLSEAQELVWINPAASSSEMNNVLLFTPGLGTKVAERFLTEYPPHWVHSLTAGVDRIPALPTGTLFIPSRPEGDPGKHCLQQW